MVMNEKHTFGYTSVSSIIAILILLYASSPKLISKVAKDNDIPDSIKDVKIKPERYYYPHVDNLVLFIVDGFEVEDLKDSNFPYVSKLIKDETACLSTYRAQPFSTTLHKIKTLTTGTPTGFLDNILSVNDQFLKDNIFRLAKEKDLKIFFLSLNTNLQLFSNYENIEKLGNVNDSINNYFIKSEWDWLILHFQVSKNFRQLSNSKKAFKSNLRHLDDVIKSVHKVFLDIMRYKILIIGNSGTRHLENDFKKNSNELGPFIMIQHEPCISQNHQNYIQEFDITPMISVWTGLPIPSLSYGTIHLNLLSGLTLHEKIYASFYNTQKLLHNILNLNAIEYINSLILIFQKTVSDHGDYLRSNEKNVTAGETILKTYENLMNSFSQIINDIRMQQNASIQFLAFILLIEALVIILNTPCKSSKNLKKFAIAFGIHVALIVFVLSFGALKRVTSFVFMSKEEAIVMSIIGLIMICNTYILAKQKSFISVICSTLIAKARKSKEGLETLSSTIDFPICTKKNSIFTVLILGSILQAFSLLEISFVKSEKYIWFFLWTSICFWIIINKMKVLQNYAFSMERSDKEKFKDCQSEISIIAFVLIMHRIILSYTEIEHWLQYSQNTICASLCLFFGLMILAFVCKICYEPHSNKWETTIISVYVIFTTCAIYALKVAEGKATFYYFSFVSTGAIESILFWSGYCFGFIYGLVTLIIKTCIGRKSSANKLVASAIACCTMFMASQSNVSSVILISMQILYSLPLIDVLKNHKGSLILLHVWLGHLFYNYQQNHILNVDEIQEVIDVLFSLDFNLIICGLISIVNKCSAPILAYFLCIYGQLNNNLNLRPSESVLRINKTFMSCQLIIIIAYTVGIMFRSPTEWSWTFLCMKLLYEIIHIILLILISLGVQTVVSLHDIILTPSLSSDIV